jgi:hypothetical protein
MDEIPKIGSDTHLIPVPARSPVHEIYPRQVYNEQAHRVVQQEGPERSGSATEEGKGLFVDIYA